MCQIGSILFLGVEWNAWIVKNGKLMFCVNTMERVKANKKFGKPKCKAIYRTILYKYSILEIHHRRRDKTHNIEDTEHTTNLFTVT